MRAAVITRPGGPEVLEVREVPDPAVGPGDVLVRVRAAGLNRADLAQRAGRYPAPHGSPPDVPGLEYAGEVLAIGTEVAEAAVGDRVFGIVGGGAHAELVAAPAGTVVRMPDGLDWVEAGAIPEAFITAHDALVTQARPSAGERVLIHAVGSGVGLAAAQLAPALGLQAFGTSRTPDKVARAIEMGLSAGAAIGDPAELAGVVRRWSADGVHVALDLVGGPYTPASLETLATRGRLILIGLVAGASAMVDLRRVLSRRLSIVGTVLRARSIAEKATASRAFAVDVLPMLEARRARAVIDSVFPLEAIADAHRRVESNATFGKVVLRM